MQGITLNVHTPLTSGVGFKGQIFKLCRCKHIFFTKPSTKTYLTGVCYYLNNLEGELRLDKWDLCFVIYMFLSNNPSSGDINSSNLSCLICNMTTFRKMYLLTF